MLKTILDLVIPHRCFGCNALCDSSICADCFKEITLIDKNYCFKCGKPAEAPVEKCSECNGKRTYFKIARSLFIYEAKAENIIKGFKYDGGRFIPKEILSRGGFEGCSYVNFFNNEIFECDLITFIPSSVIKYLKRGYNPAEEIAKTVSEMIGCKYTGTLVFKQPISDQTNLNKQERAKNLKSAFKAVKKVDGLKILLIDDVYTTGVTIKQASLALKKAGAKEINVFTLARRV